MMSPILEMQPIRPVPSESDAEDDVERSTEKTHLIHTHRSRSKDRERKHSKGNGHTETPSTSHSHTDTELHEKDASPRQYVMRVQPTEESAQPQRNEQRGGPPIVYSRLPDLEGQPRNNVSSRGRGVERMTHRSSNSTCVPRSDVAQRSRHKNTYV
ncbi:unnamed protein product [Toxocara canis]|nr:unnamed protein product [Toxocara canis]